MSEKTVEQLRIELTALEESCGYDHPDVAEKLNELGFALINQELYDDCEELMLNRMNVWGASLGFEHSAVALALNNLGVVAASKGDNHKAEEFYRRSIAIWEKEIGPEHTGVLLGLNNFASHLNEQGNLAEAEKHYRRCLEICESIYGRVHPEVVRTLNNLAILLNKRGNYSEAELIYHQCLEISEKIYGQDNPNVAAVLNNLALLLNELGNYAGAEPLYRRSLDIRERMYGQEHPSVAIPLNNLALLLCKLDKHDEAETHLRRSLYISEKNFGLYHREVAEPLNNLASLLNKLGNYAEAELLYGKCLEITEKVYGYFHANVATVINNLSELLFKRGNYAAVKSFLFRSLEIKIKINGQDHPNVATLLFNIAILLNSLGDYVEAETYYRKCLDIRLNAYGEEHPEVASSMSGLASLMIKLGKYTEAELLIRNSLSIKEKIYGPKHTEFAIGVSDLAWFLRQKGNYTEAVSLIRQSLSINEKIYDSNHPEVANSINALAVLLCDLGCYTEAEQHFLRSISIMDKHAIPSHNSWSMYSVLLYKTGRSVPAIFSAKKAVNICQKLRGSVRELGKETLKSFDTTVENTYHSLAEMLINSGRLGEAEHVLGLLKEDEYFDFVRRDNLNSGIELLGISYNAEEAALNERMDSISRSLSSLCIRKNDLKRKKERTTEEESELTDLLYRIEAASREYDEFLDSLHESFGPEKAQHVDASTDLMSDLWDLEEGTAVIYTLSTKDAFHTILITPNFRKKFSCFISSADLSKKVLRFRDLVKQRDRFDLELLAKELYDIILSQLEADLKDARISTLLWMLEGSLRLLPVSALHDGDQYIVGKYRNVLLTTKSRTNLKFKPKSHWNALGMGVTCGYEQFKPLPAVKDELEGIVRKNDATYGILPGEILLDVDFTWDAMSNELEDGYQAVHIASHFNLDPCNETMSYLLLGDGSHLTLDKLKSQQALFRGVDLLVFSACSTGIGSASKRGREVDGIGYVGETQGAKAVMATLWPVADESTSILMRRFYELREAGNTKAEALRLAQVGLLDGTIKPAKELIERSGENAYRYEIDEEKPYSHPYYWAPFIMIGNWM